MNGCNGERSEIADQLHCGTVVFGMGKQPQNFGLGRARRDVHDRCAVFGDDAFSREGKRFQRGGKDVEIFALCHTVGYFFAFHIAEF